MKQTIGLLMVVRNEEKRIKKCLDWHLPFVDQVSICDQSSDDKTFDILKEYKANSKIPFNLIQDKNWGFCEPSKQKTADLLFTDWIFYVDADETFPVQFLEKMHQIVAQNDEYDGFTFPRRNIFDVQVFTDRVPIEPKWLSIEHPSKDYQLRLTRRNLSWFPDLLHHRVRIKKKEPKIGKMIYGIDHRKTITEQWGDNDRYQTHHDKIKNG